MHHLFNKQSPLIMGILNVTPDSFSDGNQYLQLDPAVKHAEQMLQDGADIIDIGGESTRPGAAEVSADEEIHRVIPVLEKLKSSLDCLVSVDTSKPQVMHAAVAAGADMINDVRALTLPGAMEIISKHTTPVCLMHMQGDPKNMQNNPQYEQVVIQVKNYLAERIQACEAAGVNKNRIIIDPGFGFGKTLAHNLALLKQLDAFTDLGVGVLAGLSRKSMLGQITGRELDERLAASLAVALIAMQQGAQIIRVHDVKQTLDVKKIFLATR